ncbi:Alpha/Beta hydrolase fold [Amanita muscaria]
MASTDDAQLSWPPLSGPVEIVDIPIRTPLPIYPPPEDALTYPPLPSPQRQPLVHPSFRLSTHLVPAAYLRTTRYVSPPPASFLPNWRMAKEEKLKKANETRGWLQQVKGSDAVGKKGYERVLWICVNRYYRLDLDKQRGNGKGLTLFFAHANGFPKEIWEPTLRYLLASCSHLVEEIWTWEAVQHGDSALLNEKSLSCIYDWMDNARDILNFFTHFVPCQPSSAVLPVHLPRVSGSIAKERALVGLQARNIVAIAHSFGGCSCTSAALTNANLFSSLVLIDPVIMNPYLFQINEGRVDPLLIGALIRRDTWKSKFEAHTLFKRNPFFAAWDPEVLDLYVEHGLYSARDEMGDEIVRLKTPAFQEAVVFLEEQTRTEVFARLHTLDVKIKLRWVMPGKIGPNELGPPGSARERVWLRPENSSNIRIPGADHLIVQEKPRELANEITDFLNKTYSRLLQSRL